MQVALAWVLSKQAVSAPIIGASKPGRFEDAIKALELCLTADESARLEEAYRPHRVLGHQ